ncbi:MAG: hypothetical protein V3S55_09500 [Nitrospiraceae bacterium]
MADKIWQGTTGDINAAGNWSGAAVPVDGDFLHFTGDSVVDVDGSTVPAGFDAIGGFFVHPDYTGTIAASGSKLIFATIDTIRFESQGGRAFLQTSGGASAVNDVVINTPAGLADMFEINGHVDRFQIVGTTGSCTITATANGPIEILMVDSPNCTLTIGANITTIHRIRMNLGRIVNNSLVTATKNNAGAVAQDAAVIITGGLLEHKAGAVTNLFLAGSGVVEYTSGGTITDFFGMGPGSLFDGRKNRSSSITLTDAQIWPGCTMLLKNALDSFVLPTNGVKNFGGVLDLETGRGVKKE